MNRVILCSFFLLLASCAAPAPQRIRTEGHWQVMVANSGKSDMLCYAGATPVKSAGSLSKRDAKPYLMATRRPSGKIEISASAGYAFMRGSKVELAVDGNAYSLFYQDATAWAHDDAEDKAIIESMKSAEDIEVHGVSQAGLTSTDYYSPQGFVAAIARIRELCP